MGPEITTQTKPPSRARGAAEGSPCGSGTCARRPPARRTPAAPPGSAQSGRRGARGPGPRAHARQSLSPAALAPRRRSYLTATLTQQSPWPAMVLRRGSGADQARGSGGQCPGRQRRRRLREARALLAEAAAAAGGDMLAGGGQRGSPGREGPRGRARVPPRALGRRRRAS